MLIRKLLNTKDCKHDEKTIFCEKVHGAIWVKINLGYHSFGKYFIVYVQGSVTRPCNEAE